MTLGVGVAGVGWCGIEHIRCFARNPHTEVRMLCGRDEGRVRQRLAEAGIDLPGVTITTRYEDLVESGDVQVVSIATPNDLHVPQAVLAARAGRHVLLEKPTALDVEGLVALRDAVADGGVRTIVSFELRYNPLLQFVHWLRESGRLGRILYARADYLSRVTDWYGGWDWSITRERGGSHLLLGGCHAMDALRWLSGLEVEEVSAWGMQHTAGYEFPTTMAINLKLSGGAIGQLTSSTDFQMPYTFAINLAGERASVQGTLILWKDEVVDLAELQAANPFADVQLEAAGYGSAGDGSAIRIVPDVLPDSVDTAHHPFQAEVDDLVDAILGERETMLNMAEAQRSMEACLAADRSAANDGMPVRLPLT